MAKDPAFLFYSSDFLTGVADLTMEERGQFITLLCLQHQKGRLSSKAVALAVPSATADVMAKFKLDDNGLYYNPRLEEEAKKRAAHSEKQRNRALDGWKKRKGKSRGEAVADAVALPLENENENVNENKDINVNVWPTFEDFWELYDKKKERKKCEVKWKKIKQADRELIMETLPAYIASTPDIQYRKHPYTYLNGECWHDEITEKNDMAELQKAFEELDLKT